MFTLSLKLSKRSIDALETVLFCSVAANKEQRPAILGLIEVMYIKTEEKYLGLFSNDWKW